MRGWNLERARRKRQTFGRLEGSARTFFGGKKRSPMSPPGGKRGRRKVLFPKLLEGLEMKGEIKREPRRHKKG